MIKLEEKDMKLFHTIMAKIYPFPFTRNYEFSQEAEDYFLAVLDDPTTTLQIIDEYECRISREGKATTIVWIANANYACLDSVSVERSSGHLFNNAMPSRWTVKRFMKLVKVAQEEYDRQEALARREKLKGVL